MTRAKDQFAGDMLSGGMETARSKAPATPEEAAVQAAVQADALAYLTRQGLADGPESIAAILGLVGEPSRRTQAAVVNRVAFALKPCLECGERFTPRRAEQVVCSKACSNRRTGTLRRARLRGQNPDDAGGES